MFVRVPSYTSTLGANSATRPSVQYAVGLDIDLRPRQLGGETGVLALFADRERQLVIRHERPHSLGAGIQDEGAGDLRRRKRVRDESGELWIVVDDIDLLTRELFCHGAHAAAEFPDARALGV